MTTSTVSAGLAIFGGILTVLSPCVLPILPVLIGRSLSSHPYGPLALVTGVISSFAIIGSLVGVTASWGTVVASFRRNVAIILVIFAGLSGIFPYWNYRILNYLPFCWGKDSDASFSLWRSLFEQILLKITFSE